MNGEHPKTEASLASNTKAQVYVPVPTPGWPSELVSLKDYHNALREIERLTRDVERLEKLVYVPGHWKCAKCGFYLVSNNLHVPSGNVSANNDPQQCANGCGPMWRVTERDGGNQAAQNHIDFREKVWAALGIEPTAEHETLKRIRALSEASPAPETPAEPPVGLHLRYAQTYRALERLHYAVKNLAEAHAFDLTGAVRSDHESSLWLDLNKAQANAAQKIEYFAEKASGEPTS